MEQHRVLKGYLFAAAGAALFSTKAIFIKLAYMEQANAALLLALRMAVALPFFLAVGFYALHQLRKAGKPLPGWGMAVRALLAGFIGYYISSLLDFEGLVYITAQLERLVLGCALTFAVYQLLAKNFITAMGSALFTSIALSGSAVACIIHYIVTSRSFDFSSSPRFFWLAAGTGFFATVLPSFLVNAGLSRISPLSTSMIATISPLITISLAVWILGEPFTLVDALGSVMVIAGVGIYALTDVKAKTAA